MIRSLKSLWHLAVAYFSRIYFANPAKSLTIIGVTGTDGKTTTTSIIYEILKIAGIKASMITSVHAVIAGKSYDTGFHVTTPNAFWVQKYLREAVNHGDTHMVLEVTSHGLSQYRVWGIPFAVGVITNVTHEHLDWHKSMDAYVKTKLMLLQKSAVAVVNKDEKALYTKALQVLGKQHPFISYGLTDEAMVNPRTAPFTTILPGKFNQSNCLAALATAKALEIDPGLAAEAIAAFGGVPGRMETVATKPFPVVVDFAHTPNAIEKALGAVRTETRGKLIHVFGSAGLRDHTKRPLMGAASAKFADVVVLTEEDYRTEDVQKIMDEIQKGIPTKKKVYRYPNREEAIRFALSQGKPKDTVIITGKGHEKSLCRGTVEYPWSDQDTVRKILQKR